MTVRTVVWTRNVTSPGTYTETETEYIVTPPGFVDDPSTLPMNVGIIGNTLSRDTLIGFRGFDATNLGKKAFDRRKGYNSKWMGRVVDDTTLNDNKIKVGSGRYAGNGVITECRVGAIPSLRFGEVENMYRAMNRPSTRLPADNTGPHAYASSLLIAKPSAENWLAGYSVHEKITSGVTTYSIDGSTAGFTSVKAIGAASFAYAPGSISALIEVASGCDINSLNFLNIRANGSLGTFATFTGSPVGALPVSSNLYSSLDGLSFGIYATARPVSVGVVVSFISPNVYVVKKSPAIPKETVEAQFRAAVGIREFHLFCVPGMPMDTATFPIGNGLGSRYALKTLDRSLTNMKTSLIFDQTSSVDREYKDRAYVRAPILVGSADGGDIAVDVTLPAPFGSCRIVWSPTRKSFAEYNTCRSTTSTIGDQTQTEALEETNGSGVASLSEFGATIYEPVLVERIAITASVPSGYVANTKRRVLGEIRAGSEPCGLVNRRDNRPYGGGAWNPWIGGIIDLSTIPASVPVTLVHRTSATDPVPASPITVGWMLWDAPTEAYVLTGSTSNLTLIETGTPTVNTARFSGTMPTPPSGNRQTDLRVQVVIPGAATVICGFNSKATYLSAGNIILYSEARSSRRRIWPWSLSKNKIIGSDATVFEAENVGAIWTDPTPSPIVTYSSDFTPSWVGQAVQFSGCPIWTVTNRATSTECRTMETAISGVNYALPQYISYRVKVVGASIYLATSSPCVFSDDPQWIYFSQVTSGATSIAALAWKTATIGILPSGTVLQIEVKAQVNWRLNNSSSRMESPATIFTKTYTMTVP